jgi:DNA (cytosine-5)-methyltransferase 1
MTARRAAQDGRPSSMRERRFRQRGKILDLFAGAGGWEEGLRPLGLAALGVEVDAWACRTAVAAGHARLQADLSALDPRDFAPTWGLLGSPPCQAYSTAGKGLGRADKPLVVACAHELAAGNDTRAARLAECQDARSLLTVEPLRFALALRPRWIALEQVPSVLELWTLFAGLLAAHGYHTAAGVMRAECYGVPQTRRRAFLIASLDGPVSLPAPTHRSYDARRTKIPAGERDLQPWVSMAQALGCHPGGVVHTNNQTNGGRRPCGLSRSLDAPARTLDTASRQWTLHPPHAAWGMRNRRWYPECIRSPGEPAPTITATGNQSWVHRQPANAVRVTVEQAAILQGFPAGYPWQGPRGRQFQQVGNAVPPPLARRVVEQAITPGGES